MATYNCRHDGDQYRVSKFNRHGEVESSYLCDHVNCQCPAGVRDTCRHRLMLPAFLEHGLVNTHLFLDWDNGRRIVDFQGHSAILPATNITATEIDERMRELRPIPGDALLEALVDSAHNALADLAPQALTDSYTAEDIEALPDGLEKEYHHEMQALTDTCGQSEPAASLEGWGEITPADVGKPVRIITPTTPQWRRF